MTVDNSQSHRKAYAHRFDSDADFPTIEHIKVRPRDAPTVEDPVQKASWPRWSVPALGEAHVIPGEDFGKGVELVQHTETLDDHRTGDETRPEHIREDVPPERKLQQAG
ncbi:MAG: hypothetical protein Q9180_002579 [Flavoplaca navasiana]